MKFFFQSEELGLIQWDYAPAHKQAEPGRVARMFHQTWIPKAADIRVITRLDPEATRRAAKEIYASLADNLELTRSHINATARKRRAKNSNKN